MRHRVKADTIERPTDGANHVKDAAQGPQRIGARVPNVPRVPPALRRRNRIGCRSRSVYIVAMWGATIVRNRRNVSRGIAQRRTRACVIER